MAVHFSTTRPAELLAAFDERIQQKEPKGKITTWEKKNGLYTHKSDEWAKKAWLKPTVAVGRLTFNIFPPQNETLKVTVYGYYHGHLIETFLNHFDKLFTSGCASALAEREDKVG